MFAGDTPLTVEDLVRNHLDAIGTAQVRSATQSRAVQGTAVYRILVGGSGSVEGKTGMVSEGRKLRFMAKFPRGDYRGEQFIFNEGRFEIAFANVDQTRLAVWGFRTDTDRDSGRRTIWRCAVDRLGTSRCRRAQAEVDV